MAWANVPVVSPQILSGAHRPDPQHVYTLGVFGGPRTGKFWGCRPLLRNWANERRGAFLGVYPHPQENAPLTAQEFQVAGHAHRIEFDSLDDPNHCLPLLAFPKSTHPDPYQRAMDNVDARDRLIELLGRNRRENIEKQTTIIELATHAINLCMSAAIPTTFRHLLAIGKDGHPLYHDVLDAAEDEELQRYWVTFPKQGAAARKELAAYWRLVDQKFGDPRILAREGDPRQLRDMLEARKLLVVEGGRSSRATRTFLGLLLMSGKHHIRSHFIETGKPLNVLEVSDEVQNFDLFTGYEANAHREMKKMGLHAIVISHGPRFLQDADENSEALQTFDALHSYAIRDWTTALAVAQLCAGGALDPYLEHHREIRSVQRHAGFYSIPTTTTTVTRGRSGERDTESTSTGKRDQWMPTYETREEETVRYVPLDDQLKIVASRLMQLANRQRLVRSASGVRWESVPEMEEPWIIPEYGRAKFAGLLRELHQRPQYRIPSIGAPVAMRSLPSSASTRQPSGRSSNGRNGHSTTPSPSTATKALSDVLRRTGRNRDVR